LRAVAGGGAQYGSAQPSLRPVAQPEAAVMLQTFDDVVKLIESRRDVTLKLDVQRYVRLVDFKPGVISFEPAPGAPANLSARLREWTGQRWMMDLQVGGGETAYEREQRARDAARAKIEADPFVVAMMSAFPGAEIVGMTFKPVVEPVAAPLEEDGADD
jgi:DNA polymerase-3 subunit gamma/tau